MVAAYFDLDVDVEIEVGKLRADHHAEVGQESVGFYCIEFSKKFLTTASEEDIIRVAAHEMIHVKQFAKEELDPALTRWKTKDHSRTEYWEQPWEKEARRLQAKLVANFEKQFV